MPTQHTQSVALELTALDAEVFEVLDLASTDNEMGATSTTSCACSTTSCCSCSTSSCCGCTSSSCGSTSSCA
jgi:thiazolylpeptide-type bacteriocin precursor